MTTSKKDQILTRYRGINQNQKQYGLNKFINAVSLASVENNYHNLLFKEQQNNITS